MENFETQNVDKNIKENRKLKRKVKRLRMWIGIGCVACLLVGFVFGNMNRLNVPSRSSAMHSKLEEGLNIMTQNWYFAHEIDDVRTRLEDEALRGMTTNEEDPHTTYMSQKEMEDFFSYLNRSFVGIGVHYSATEDGLRVVQRVFKDSPAEKAGVLAGDIIHAVDGVVVTNLSNQEITDMVRGEAGSVVHIDFLRNGKTVSFSITRQEIHATVFGEMRDDFGYLQIAQFGETTAKEVRLYLEEFASQNVSKLLIDLRDDGGGYLEALTGIANCLLPSNEVYFTRMYADGSVDKAYTKGKEITGFDKIVILVNENTASASEALTLCLMEQRDDVTVVGKKTYGKGTVQVTLPFNDGSALKYTNSKWASPNGVCINGEGITPDIEVDLPDIMNTTYKRMEEGEVIEVDTVSEYALMANVSLKYLGYDVKREDSYFDESLKNALNAYKKDHGFVEDGLLDEATYTSIVSSFVHALRSNKDNDTQYAKAVEVLHG